MALTITRIVELCGGQILIDDVDVGKIDLDQLKDSITVIPQDPTLFRASLRSNLDTKNIWSDDFNKQILSLIGRIKLLEKDDSYTDIDEK